MFRPPRVNQHANAYDYVFKVVVVGDSGTGKTCLTSRWATGQFIERCPSTVGVDFFTRTLNIGALRIKLEVWDTAGTEQFYTLTQNYYHFAKAAIVVYDVTDHQSLHTVSRWLDDIDRFGHMGMVKAVVGTKSDLGKDTLTSEDDFRRFTGSHDVIHIADVSAKSGHNVDVVFWRLAKILTEEYRIFVSDRSVTLENSKINRSKCYCLR